MLSVVPHYDSNSGLDNVPPQLNNAYQLLLRLYLDNLPGFVPFLYLSIPPALYGSQYLSFWSLIIRYLAGNTTPPGVPPGPC